MKKWKSILCLILAFLSFLAAIYYWLSSKNIQNTEKIIFLSSEETQKVLSEDADHYYQTFHKTDLKLRKSKNIQDYLAKISNSGCEPEEENKEKIRDCIEKVSTKLESSRNDTIDGIHIGKMLDLPWKIGFTCDKIYENGLPHTRGEVIILNNQDLFRRNITETCKLLIHEKVHIYQKHYKEEFSNFLNENYEKVENIKRVDVPSNPDLDDNTYRDKKTHEILKGEYNKKPKHFRDIKFLNNDQTNEHPNELVAYSLQNKFDS